MSQQLQAGCCCEPDEPDPQAICESGSNCFEDLPSSFVVQWFGRLIIGSQNQTFTYDVDMTAIVSKQIQGSFIGCRWIAVQDETNMPDPPLIFGTFTINEGTPRIIENTGFNPLRDDEVRIECELNQDPEIEGTRSMQIILWSGSARLIARLFNDGPAVRDPRLQEWFINDVNISGLTTDLLISDETQVVIA